MIGKNNPFNIRVSNSRWIGSCGSTRGFVDFSSLEYGVRAACILIMRSYRMKDVLTISEIINRYAPKNENDTAVYIAFICSNMGSFPFDIPKCVDFPRLLHFISRFEGNPISISTIQNVINNFKIVPFKC